jgi:hypothetical protein
MCVPLPSEIVSLGYQVFRCPGEAQLLIEHAKMQLLCISLQGDATEDAIERFSQMKGATKYGSRFVHTTRVFPF